MAVEKKDSIELTPKQVGVILAVILAIAGGVPTGLNKLIPEARRDPFTGSEGIEIRGRLDIIELHLKQVMEDDEECRSRQVIIENGLSTLRELVTTYQASTKRWDAHQDKLIDDCMRRTQ